MEHTSTATSPTPEQRLHLHSRLLAATHSFFHSRNVREVITPCMVSTAYREPNIENFSVDSQQLRSSPEYEMKRLLMTAQTDIYQIAPVFRKGEYGNKHRPEFVMLEWYRLGWNYHRLMEECLTYLRTMIAKPDIKMYPLSYQKLFNDSFNCNPFDCDNKILATLANDLGYSSSSRNRAEYLDFLFDNATTLYSASQHPNTLIAIYDFPIEQSSYARISSRYIAERFEIFLNGIELANGYGELTQAADYYQRVQLHHETRGTQLSEAITIDEDFMNTLKKYGLRECAGVSVGMQRLLMCIAQTTDIAEVDLL